MKKYLTVFLGLIIGIALIGAVFFVAQNKVDTSVESNVPQNESELETEAIEKPIVENKDNTIRPAENLSGFPLQLPPGFTISIFAKNLQAPRVIFDDEGPLLVSIPSEGKVVALPDDNNDGVADRQISLVEGLNRPHGLYVTCIHDGCELFIAESHQVTKYTYDLNAIKATPLPGTEGKIADLPNGGMHHSRTIFPLDSSNLLISTGSNCNACIETDQRRAAIIKAPMFGSNTQESSVEVFAKGLRNAVFMAQHPFTDDIWATEMGRDMLGDDLPPDEINILKDGGDYGWPYCYGKNVTDTTFNSGNKAENLCEEPAKTSSHIDIPAHSAPLGLAFIPREGWPEEYWDDLLVAFHGSWNRSTPTGYKIVRMKLDEQGNFEGMEDFITGWFSNGTALGRPVDIVIRPNGIMYVSDDRAGVIYRVEYKR